MNATQKIEIYFNFIGEYIPLTMVEKEPTPEEPEEMRKKEARKDKWHQNYLKRKAGDREKGIYHFAGEAVIPRAIKHAVL